MPKITFEASLTEIDAMFTSISVIQDNTQLEIKRANSHKNALVQDRMQARFDAFDKLKEALIDALNK